MTAGTTMSPRQFDWRLRVRGPALSTWPAAEREAALVLLAADSGAQDRLAAALEEDGTDGLPPDPAFLLRTQRRLRREVALRAKAVPTLRWGVRGGALAACLAAGLWAGGVLDAERDPLATVQVAALEALQ